MAAARSGARVVMIEKRTDVGVPVRCAEYIPKLLAMEVGMSPAVVAQEVLSTETFINAKREARIKAPGYIINRDIFDKELADQAVRNGARLFNATKALQRTKKGVLVSQDGHETEITCKIIIGADGPVSTVGAWINQKNGSLVKALQSTVVLTKPTRHCEIYFEPEFYGGYGWLFPKGDVANVGVGVVAGRSNLRRLLDGFIERLSGEGKVLKTQICSTGGMIPVGGPVKTVVENIMLVGDAAGQTHPITGAGISQAVLCGKLAGESAASAALENDLFHETQYEKKWKMLYGSSLEIAGKKRKEMEARWRASDFQQLIRRSWIGFREYHATA
jgi:geranylgeranyl reductase family protein